MSCTCLIAVRTQHEVTLSKFHFVVIPLLGAPPIGNALTAWHCTTLKRYKNSLFLALKLERLALNRLRSQMLESPLYSELQSAYRKGHSTETALLHMLNGVYAAVDSKRAAFLVALDISAAFDTIRHSLLLSRLKTDYVLSWLESYLTCRQQFVKLGRHSSASSPCTAGVPQGSILGPLLFTAYVSPIGRVIVSSGALNSTHSYRVVQYRLPSVRRRYPALRRRRHA